MVWVKGQPGVISGHRDQILIFTENALGPYNSIMSFPSPARIMILDPHCQTDNLKIIHYFGETHLKSCFHP